MRNTYAYCIEMGKIEYPRILYEHAWPIIMIINLFLLSNFAKIICKLMSNIIITINYQDLTRALSSSRTMRLNMNANRCCNSFKVRHASIYMRYIFLSLSFIKADLVVSMLERGPSLHIIYGLVERMRNFLYWKLLNFSVCVCVSEEKLILGQLNSCRNLYFIIA